MEIQTAHRILDAITKCLVEHLDECDSAKAGIDIHINRVFEITISLTAYDDDGDVVLSEMMTPETTSIELAHFGQLIDDAQRWQVYDAEITDDLVDRLRMAISDAYEEAR